ncbi:unnamed protein product [Gulo gulo]|uniref:Uncharacterized protein n=1 Tax=Gulo gulo TaxID=48420 RepID=A0A9X9M3E9_GULGU|nr:unnamed protein product [Gulo gulo]
MGLLRKLYLLRTSSSLCLHPSSAGKLRAVWRLSLSSAPGLESLTGQQGSGFQSPFPPVAATRSPGVREAEERQAWVSFGCPCGPLGPSWPLRPAQDLSAPEGPGLCAGKGRVAERQRTRSGRQNVQAPDQREPRTPPVPSSQEICS